MTFLGDGSPYAMGPLSVCLSVCPVCDVGVLWPNGWMDQDNTWHGDRPRPWPHCVRWGPSSPSPKGHSPQFSAHVCCGQTARWIKMPHGTEVGLGAGDIVLDGEPSYLKKGHSPRPLFGPYLLWPNGRPSQLLLSTCICMKSRCHLCISCTTSQNLDLSNSAYLRLPWLCLRAESPDGGEAMCRSMSMAISIFPIIRRYRRLRQTIGSLWLPIYVH